MKLALVTDTYAPRIGGIEAQVAGLAARLRAAGHEVDVHTATAGPREPGVVRFPGIAGAVPNPLTIGRSRDALRGYDLVHAHMGVVSPFAQAAVGAAVAHGTPAVVTVHSMLAGAAPVVAPLLRRWAESGVILSAVSPVAGLDVHSASAAEVLVLPNGIDTASWRPDGRTPGDPLTVVCTSRLAERKRVVPLVRSFARAHQLAPGRLRLVVVGDGPQFTLVDEARRRHGIDDVVRMAGSLGREQLRELLWAADVFVSPVRLEAFGIAALEARAAGLPVIGYRGSGVSALVDDGRTGLLVDGDTRIAVALARLATDPALLETLQSASLAEPPPFDWDDVVPQVLAAYRQAGA